MKRLTLSQQKKLCYVISAENEPVLYVDEGESVVVETEDAWSGQIRKDSDERDKTAIPFSNPVSGPIYVNGAGKGDTLVVSVEKIKPLIGQGATRCGYLYGLLDDTFLNKFLGVNIPERTRIIPIRDGKVYFSDDIVLPYKPMIGTIATAPEIGA